MTVREKFALKRKMSKAEKDIKNFCLAQFDKLSITDIQKRIEVYKHFKDIDTLIQRIQEKEVEETNKILCR